MMSSAKCFVSFTLKTELVEFSFLGPLRHNTFGSSPAKLPDKMFLYYYY